ncbi:MAG: endolytic transglycosylase MltG [Oscillospiraceae bacterium]|nr:endolytic transglycosylase MltG [Oscillospiraceae bacterium]
MTGVLYFLFVVCLSALLAGFGWMSANEVLGLSKPEGQVTVEVPEGATISEITAILQEQELVQWPWLFKLYANVTDAESKIVPGTYTVDTNLDYMAIVSAMKKGSQYRAIVKVVIPEGFTMKDIFARLAENKVCDEASLWATARTHKFSYSFLDDLPIADNRLEGYLFPDTYDFYVGEDPVDVLSKMLSNFNRKLTADMRARAESMGYSIHEIVTIAAMVEREAANAQEAPTIASVIYNRLRSDSFPYLEIDATILYALPEHKDQLTDADLQIDSPYNTRLYPGLPPGPIASPGRSSLVAALDPDETNYYFYAVNKDGVHQFSRTLAEHNKVVEEAKQAAAAGG